MPGATYHEQIDGLRAIAVLVIILFHLQVPGFSGGFIGVDVFFVVSGFLITQIIVSNLTHDRFTFRDFYIRRVTRIIPALAITVAAVLLAALYFQSPRALAHTAREAVVALLSVSNFFYWSESNYWSPAAETFTLLHTWSLGVEEQFYLVYPLLLVVAHRLGGARGVVILLLLTFGVSLLASEFAARYFREAAFYLTPLRFYEFALGGLGTFMVRRVKWLHTSRWVSAAATLSGVMLILAATHFFDSQLPLPGVLMLLPLSGTLLIILAGPSRSARVLLCNPVMSWLGKVSYSLYLVHWPIIVFYRQYIEFNPTATQLAGLFVSMLLAAGALNRLVERRFRLIHGGSITAAGMPARNALWYTGGSALFCFVAAGVLVANNGWPTRFPPSLQAQVALDPQKDRVARKLYLKATCTPAGELFCGERVAGKRTILLLADSRATDIYIALQEAYPQANIMVSYALGCPPTYMPVIGNQKFLEQCPEFNQARLAAAEDGPEDDVIFIAADLSLRTKNALFDTVRRLRAAGKTVFLLGQFQMLEKEYLIESAIRDYRSGEENYLVRYMTGEPFSFDGDYAHQVAALGAVYVSNKAFFFDGRYHLHDRQTGNLLTEDGVHLNAFGAKKFGQYLRERYPLPG